MSANRKAIRSEPLERLVEITGGGTPSKGRPEFYDGDIPWVTPKDMKAWYIDDSEDHITADAVASSTTKYVDPGAVLVCIRSGVLAHTLPVAVTRIGVTLNQDLKAFRCGPDIQAEYLARFLQWYAPRLLQTVRGTTAHNLSMDVVKSIDVPLPPLPEQRRVAAILDKADAIRRKRQEAIRLTDQFLRSAFLEMFGDPVSNRKGFPRVKLSDLAAADGIKCGPFGTQLSKSEYRSNGVPLWGIKHVNVHFRLPTHEFLDAAKARLLDQYSLEPGDIVMTRKGTIGNCAVYPGDFAPGVMHSDLLRIRIDTTRSLPICLTSQLTLSRDVERQIAQISHGAVMAGINVTKLKSIEVLVPPMPLQRKFARLVERHARTYDRQVQAGQEAEGFFHSLVQRAFRGQL